MNGKFQVQDFGDEMKGEDLLRTDFLSSYWGKTKRQLQRIWLYILIASCITFVGINGIHISISWLTAFAQWLFKWGLWSVVIYFLGGELFLWYKAIWLMGASTIGHAPRNLVIGLRAFPGAFRILFMGLAIFVGYTIVWLIWPHSYSYLFCTAVLLFHSNHLLQFMRPPAVLFLAKSSQSSITTFGKIYACAKWQRTVTLVDPDLQLKGKEAFGMGANLLRVTADSHWREVIVQLMESVPLIIVDAREISEGLIEEGKWLFDKDLLRKSLFIVNKDGTSPLLKYFAGGFDDDPGPRVLQHQEEEVWRGVIWLTQSRNNLKMMRRDMARVLSQKFDAESAPDIEIFKLLDVVKEIVGHYRRELRSKGHTVTLSNFEELPSIEADRSVVKTALLNIIAIAITFGTPRTPIVIAARRDGDIIFIDIRNRTEAGWGDEVERIFEPDFQKSESFRKLMLSGWGPIHLAWELITKSGGNIALRKNDNDGTISIHLPLVKKAHQNENRTLEVVCPQKLKVKRNIKPD